MIYFVDINLPKDFSFFQTVNFVFVKDISNSLSDIKIWDLALENNYTILTRDKDFYYRALQTKKCSKIVLFRLGNTKNHQLTLYFQEHWQQIESYLKHHQLIVLWPAEIQIIL
jgi:predicted nuclease of predicted toxin-antitoxin system